MDEVGKLIIQKPSAKVGASMSDLVMAWACDSDSGEPRYILELGPDRRGSMCRCECASCGLALIAVNAAKAEFVKRPHFRHPEGAERDECMVLAARAAVLRQLQLLGTIDLPRRQKSSTFRGLSGRLYEAWVERPATRLHISQVNFEDRATAVVTFDDGRRLRVELVGSIGGLDTVDGRGNPIPTVTLEVDDPAIAGMSPEDLRQRLELLPSAVCWRHHWDDETLKCEAAVAAHQAAIGSFDAVPDDLSRAGNPGGSLV